MAIFSSGNYTPLEILELLRGIHLEGIRRSFAPLIIEGQTYEFPHLLPSAIDLLGHGPENRDLRVRISYRSHVFSQSCNPSDQNFHFKDELGRKRRFCPDRYQISKAVPAVCRRILTENGATWISKDHNHISNLATVDGALVSGNHDLIVYYLFPSSVDGLDVEMVVKSTYNKAINFEHIKRKYKMIQQVKTCFYQDKQVP